MYDTLNLQVPVYGLTSAPYALRREAASVRGTATLPGATKVQALALPARTAPAFRSPLAMEDLMPPAVGLLCAATVPALGVTRLTYATSEQAHTARQILLHGPRVTSVELDDMVRLDAQGEHRLNVSPSCTAQWFWPLEGYPAACL